MKTCNVLNEATDKKITELSKICLSKNTELYKKIAGKELINLTNNKLFERVIFKITNYCFNDLTKHLLQLQM